MVEFVRYEDEGFGGDCLLESILFIIFQQQTQQFQHWCRWKSFDV